MNRASLKFAKNRLNISGFMILILRLLSHFFDFLCYSPIRLVVRSFVALLLRCRPFVRSFVRSFVRLLRWAVATATTVGMSERCIHLAIAGVGVRVAIRRVRGVGICRMLYAGGTRWGAVKGGEHVLTCVRGRV